MQIYLDYSATTPPHPDVLATLHHQGATLWGNPSSLHHWGERAAIALETARWQVAQLLNAPTADSIHFTSGGTEADNLAIFGVAHRYPTPQHIIISAVEHPAIAAPARQLAARGWQVTELPVDATGKINPLELLAALQPNTVLVSIIYGQSEIGTVQAIAELAQIARRHRILFHTDAVQVAGRLPLDVQALDVDLLSVSGHKLYGPQGSGALYVRPGVELVPLLAGGGQEHQLRSGTQAVPTLAGFGLAAQLAQEQLPTEAHRLEQLRDRLITRLEACPYFQLTGHRRDRLPHHASFVLRDFPSEITGRAIVRQMNLAGIALSAGSACHSGQASPSPILTALGYGEIQARQGIRFSLGRDTTPEDIDWTVMALQQVLHRLNPSPLPCVGSSC
ncbi:cysteine desulfurase family protein [Spirulina major CS-329]|uniref:cysteine desulfurase family protein n=1 Tax=Spirulina TaxID=1154 RepID=UPI00232EE8B8|nr:MULTISPECIES: cysteine desulfurase family protein [Spirulina]MDB9494965.1 cysteine desulfurase family protein [Spirulina subsalsa CS-330]MDB9503834.1 cysteine desulfurase family protein [Spirulina major CS-329]